MPYKTCLFLFVLISLSACHPTSSTLLSPNSDQNPKEAQWETEYWSKQENYSDSVSSQYSTTMLLIETDSFSVNRWFRKISIKPYAHYKVSGYLKTENLVSKNGSGAGFGLGNISFQGDTIFQSNQDWTYVEMEFDSQNEDSFMLECWLGKNGQAKGKVYFDNLKLEEISSEKLAPQISFNLEEKREPMSPLLYGQFIEHMGKSIYGGLWAEILSDRKFYYKPGSRHSPWQTNADSSLVSQDKSHAFSQGILPILQVNENISMVQDSLQLVFGEEYIGRIVFKASSGIERLKISVQNGEEQIIFNESLKSNSFVTLPFSFKLNEDIQFSSFKIEFIGNGSVTLAATSLMPANNIEGFRSDVLTLLKELNSPIYRWPGGNFVSGYNWKDGIGNPDQRPTRFDKAWNGLEYNDVGIDEFMTLCKLLNAEANIAVNTGLGTAEMAAEEVEYVNGSTQTKMGNWRKENGNEKPYSVRLWAVGNEMFGDWQLGHMPIEDYVEKHNRVAKAMKQVDPNIELIAVGFPGKWNEMMYTHTANEMDYISEHFYRQDWHAGGLLTHVKQIPEAIRSVAEEHRKQRKDHPELKNNEIKIALDEWNYWYGPHVYGLLGTRYFLRDAMGIAAGFNEFARQSDIFYMANYAQTVNVIGAIKTTPTDSWLEGTGLVLKLYREEFGSIPIEINGYSAPLDVAATVTKDEKFITFSVINATHQDHPLKIDGTNGIISELGDSFILRGKNDMVYNDENHKDNIRIEEGKTSFSNGTLMIPKETAGIYKFRIL